MEGIIWLAILIIMVVIEIITMGLTTVWFAGGALVAFIASLLGAGVPMQIALFLVVSLLLLGITRPIALRFFNTDRVKTNAESLIGITGVVLENIDNLNAAGLVLVNGQEWSARSTDNAAIEKGEIVQVEGIRGVKLIVKKEEKKMEG